jgi:hypothetical protein
MLSEKQSQETFPLLFVEGAGDGVGPAAQPRARWQQQRGFLGGPTLPRPGVFSCRFLGSSGINREEIGRRQQLEIDEAR